MAGYKTTVKQDNPVSFHTFDLDSNALHGGMVIDEMNSNKNPMWIVGGNYELEYPSLNELEPSEQASIRIAELQKPNGSWVPMFANIPHSSDYNLEEFSLEWISYKRYADKITKSGEPGYYKNIQTPVIKKGSEINIYYHDNWYYSNTSDRLYVTINGLTVSHQHTSDYPVFSTSTPNHYVVTYGTSQIDVNEYQVKLRLYCNGRLVSSTSPTYFDSPPNVVTGEQWYIFGNGGTDPVTDYATEDFKMDQLAIYDYKMSDEQISNHYRKTHYYEDIVVLDKPSYYWRLKDIDPLTNTMDARIGTDGKYYGSHVKGETGPDKINDSMSTYFNNGGTAITGVKNTSQAYTQLLNTNANYTVEFWFNVTQNHRGILFTCHEEAYKYRGVTIFINSEDNKERTGVVQFNESQTHTLNSSTEKNYSDGKWHHIAVKRSGTNVYMYIDGEIVDSKSSAQLLGTNGDPSQMHLMGLDPYELVTDGNISEVAIYARSLQTMQINHRYHYSSRHKIFGFTLLEGQGLSAVVRFYDHITGKLIGETNSDTTGEYTYFTYNNKKMDIVALLPDNKTTRYRIHAPVIPAEFDDESV